MKKLNLTLCAFVVIALLLAFPAALPSVVAGTATGLLLMGSAGFHVSMPTHDATARAPIVQVVQMQHAARVVELQNGKGVVVFQNIDGKLVTRCFYSKA